MSLSVVSTGVNSVTLEASLINATHLRLICIGKEEEKLTADDIAGSGTNYTGPTVTLEGLEAGTDYSVLAVACNDSRGYGALEEVSFTTEDASAEMYAWEQERTGILSFTDLVLCYGGSRHRSPYRWSEERFGPFVTYIDEDGTEHWLFDSFLMLEFTSASRPDGVQYSYMVGANGSSAGREQWEELIDYWFEPGFGMDALEQAVEKAAERLQFLPGKRKVVMSMPDPIIYRSYADQSSSTVYWGELNGRSMDFSSAADRIAVYQWYINEVRSRFDAAGYRFIDLAGFYIISEELVSTDDGWNPELKKSWEVIPDVADYLHSFNHCLVWIPYNRAAGYTRWERFGVDYAYMQPNHFWDDTGSKPLTTFFSDIKSHGLAMELEFDEELLEGRADCDIYRARLRNYMDGARSNGVYGTKPLAYYQGNNVLYDLWSSAYTNDIELYHEFCRFVLENPLRE